MAEQIEQIPNKGVSSVLSNESAREILQALALPKNNHIELFPKPVLVGQKDLTTLTQNVIKKLEQLRVNCDHSLMKVVISFENDRALQLTGWDQLSKFDWNISERTNSVTLTWEFMYQRDSLNEGELHVLSVRITESINPMELLRAALSRDRSEMDSIEIKMAPVSCEIDYHDNLLSRELVQIINEWHKGLRKPIPLVGIGQFINKNQNTICKSIDYSLEILIPIAYIAGVYYWMHANLQEATSKEFLSDSIILIMCYFLVFRLSDRFSTWIARTTARNIDRMERLPIFELTSGDQNRQTEAFSKATKSMYGFWISVVVSFLINVVSAVFTFYVLGLK